MAARILVVEDETIIAKDIQGTLSGLGYDVPSPVSSGAAALEAVEKSAPDLVLMDIRIHGDVDGIDTAARIRAVHGTPVIYMTSHSDEATIRRAKGTGAYGYVLKPFGERDLRIAIEVALQKREIEQRLSEQERWFATTLRSIGDGVIAADSAQRVTFMNAVAEQITGVSARDAVGKALGDVLCLVDSTTGQRMASPLDRAFRDGFSVELPRGAVLTKAGERVAIDDTAAPIVDERGKMLGGVVVFRDVTERRRLEERLAQNVRLAAIGTLSAGMAHEINNPLAAILANVTFASEHLEELKEWLGTLPGPDAVAWGLRAREVTDALGDARDAGMRVHGIVHDLKKFGRVDGGESHVIELMDVLEGAIRLTENLVRQQARVRREYRTTPFVEANEGQLAQVFVNLLMNAAQAFTAKGDRESTVVVATYTDDEGHAVAEVRDSGPGIAPELQRRIFDPFFTTKPVGEGTGLGLSIAHSIVTALGGHISVESKVGRGATFRVTLPAAKCRAEPQALPPQPAPTRRGRVLIIDDEDAVARALARVLKRDHDVFCETDARVALSRVRAGEAFDVIFCDLMMPSMTGMEFFEALHASHPAVAARVVFLTGGAFTPGAQAFLESTSNASLSKPVEPRALRKTVAAYLEGPPGSKVAPTTS
jgi:two-component system, cell cycle sensor histidine kinase and response regulator CckA